MTNHNDQSKPLSARPVGRRDILKLGVTGAVLPAMIGPGTVSERRKTPTTTAERVVPTGPVAIGYWSGHPHEAIIDARSLSSGDPALAVHGARIEMIGMSAGADARHRPLLQSLALDIRTGKQSFRAWRYENAIVSNTSSPVAFTVPPDDRNGIDFSIRALVSGLSGTPKAGHFRLGTGSEPRVSRLRSGYYIVAIGKHGRAPKVNWSGCELNGDSTGQSIVMCRAGKPVADVPYLLFAVGVAEPEPSRFV